MSIFMTLRIALKALNRNKLRTMLTMLGMIIGVGAVITMVALGKGAQTTIEEQVKAAGTNMININAGNFTQGGVRGGQGTSNTLMPDDAVALRDVPGVQYVAAGANTRGTVIAGNTNWSTSVEGTEVDWPLIRSWPVKYGSFFTQQDVNSAAKVAVLGSGVSDTLFGPDTDPTGQVIRIRNQPFKVIGVMSSKGVGSMGNDQDDVIMVPYTTVIKKLQGQQHISKITVSASTPETAPVAAAITEVLRTRHKLMPGDPDDFMVRTLEEMASGQVGDSPHDGNPAGGDRRRLAAGRRDRDHEYHARLCHGADTRDRPADGDRRQGQGRAAAIPCRSRGFEPVRRNYRNRVRLRSCRGSGEVSAMADDDSSQRHRHGVRVCGGNGCVLRVLPRSESGTSGPD